MNGTPQKEYLSDSVFVYRTAEHRFGADALRLAAFAAPKSSSRVCDLGSGTGILPLQWCAMGLTPAHIDAVELQPDAAALAARAAEENGFADRISVHCADWNALSGVLPAASYDLITSNPPYFPSGCGKQNAHESDRLARHEPTPSMLSELCTAAARLCKVGGDFCLCHRPERITDVLCALRGVGFEPKEAHILCHKDTPWLLLVRAKRGGKPPMALRILHEETE